MADAQTDATAEGGTSPATESSPNIPTVESPPSIESLFRETQSELGDGVTPNEDAVTPSEEETTPSEEATPSEETTPSEEAAPSEEATPASETMTPSEDAPKAEGEEAPAEGEDAAVAEAKRVTQQLLQDIQDPTRLDQILREQGVEKVAEIPFIREILGRTSQSVRDQVSNALNRQQQQTEQARAILAQGFKARSDFTQRMLAARKGLEDGAAEIDVPTEDDLNTAFDQYAGAYAQNYHAQTWSGISDAFYAQPEMRDADLAAYGLAMSPEQKQALEAAKQAGPAEWLRVHQEVGRNNLWAMANATKAQEISAAVQKATADLEKAHEGAVRQLARQHEKALAEVRKNARAEAMAEIAKTGTPPRTPSSTTSAAANPQEEVPVGASIEEIFRLEKARASQAASV